MMKRVFLWSSILAVATASPAVLWKQQNSSTATLHHSTEMAVADILPAKGVVFVVNRPSNGGDDDSLTAWARDETLPQTAALYPQAVTQYHHVTGVTGAQALARTSTTAAAHVTLHEYTNLPHVLERLNAATSSSGTISMKAKKRARELEQAVLLVVSVDAVDAATIDAVVAHAIQQQQQNDDTTVMLTSVQSIQEIKRERERVMQHRMHMQQQAGRQLLMKQSKQQSRRLEEDANQQDNQQQQQEKSADVMVLVHMTPNLLAGILFTLLFATIALIGINCMGAIQGQSDVYVKKMPAIGREA